MISLEDLRRAQYAYDHMEHPDYWIDETDDNETDEEEIEDELE